MVALLGSPPSTENIHEAFHVVSKHLKAHFRADVLKALGHEVRYSHARFQLAKGVLDILTTEAHHVRRPVQ
jgi:hypothetical protein